MEFQPSIGFIPVPKAHRYPDPVLKCTFLGRENLHAHSWQSAGKMKVDAGVYTANQELVGHELRDQSGSVCVTCSRGTAAITLRISVCDGGLPSTRVIRLAGPAQQLIQCHGRGGLRAPG